MSSCIIILGGEFSPMPKHIDAEYIIACDSGYTNALKLGITPNAVIGDFDSYEGNPDDIPTGIEVLKFNPIKDDTDCMLALRHAIDRGYSHIIFLCALGGRLDHIMGNIQSMTFAATKGLRTELFSATEYMAVLTPGNHIIPKKNGYSLSLFSLSDKCEGVSIAGSEYDISNFTITNFFPIGYGNSHREDNVIVTLKKGMMLLIQSAIPK